jgi:hypothetical protein
MTSDLSPSGRGEELSAATFCYLSGHRPIH